MRCYRRHLVDLDLDNLEEGQLVKIWVARLPEGCLLDSSYILPPKIGPEPVAPAADDHPLMNRLNNHQRETVRMLLEKGPKVVFQHAPPGVDAKVAVVTAANLPLAKLAKELEEVLGGNEMEESNSIAFFSGYAKDKYREMIEALRRHMQGEVWDRFISRASEYTQIVDESYLQVAEWRQKMESRGQGSRTASRPLQGSGSNERNGNWDLPPVPQAMKNARPPFPKHMTTIDGRDCLVFFTKVYAFSNHFTSWFSIENENFSSSEQFYMAKKAKHFGYLRTAAEILETTDVGTRKPARRESEGQTTPTTVPVREETRVGATSNPNGDSTMGWYSSKEESAVDERDRATSYATAVADTDTLHATAVARGEKELRSDQRRGEGQIKGPGGQRQ
uniref:Uncharacterized protein n=1 Tax=Globodera pallida TaxID=36090 RepID=A0A183CDM0_GLOPA